MAMSGFRKKYDFGKMSIPKYKKGLIQKENRYITVYFPYKRMGINIPSNISIFRSLTIFL